MGRELRRVPLDFNWPLNTVWFGYVLPSIECALCGGNGRAPSGCDDEYCVLCEGEGIVWPKIECPTGDGYQLWETTSEGSPVSPVFATLDELCEWCATGATTFACFKASAAEWKQMLSDGLVSHSEGSVTFL